MRGYLLKVIYFPFGRKIEVFADIWTSVDYSVKASIDLAVKGSLGTSASA